MWPFRKQGVAPAAVETSPDSRLVEVTTKLMLLESRMKQLELEWENTYQQLNRLTGRMERAKGHDAAHSAGPGTERAGNQGVSIPNSAPVLSRHQRRLALMQSRKGKVNGE